MSNDTGQKTQVRYGTAMVLQCICAAAVKIQEVISQPWRLPHINVDGVINVQGETVQPLDVFANTQFVQEIQEAGACAGIASEELENFIAFESESSQRSPYVCLFDPLDGSGNINVHISIGSIFGIYRRLSPVGTAAAKKDFLQPGHRQVAAGYFLYGTATLLVYADGAGVDGFTLDPVSGAFRLTHPGIRCPLQGNITALNYGYFFQYSRRVQLYLLELQKTSIRGTVSTQRCTGSMVPDIHRCLLEGGLFMYPSTAAKPSGKLRLLYECNPMAFIVEAAGGKASNGQKRILDLIPSSLHERTVFFAGSKGMVNEILE